jgi:hypothetical protein
MYVHAHVMKFLVKLEFARKNAVFLPCGKSMSCGSDPAFDTFTHCMLSHCVAFFPVTFLNWKK